VDVILHVLDNSTKFGIDPKKAVITGCSGGGWIAAGAANLLAKKNELHRIKALFLSNANLSDSTQHMKEEDLKPWDYMYGGGKEV
jgi:acetyl esterase/lipase